MVSVEPPRTRRPSSVRQTLSQAAPASACQSTPWCSAKRRSSAAISAVDSAGETSASGTQSRRRTLRSTRSSDSAAPWRSTSSASDDTNAARTPAKPGSDSGAAADRATGAIASATNAAMRNPARNPACGPERAGVLPGGDAVMATPSTRAFGASPNISGAYIASTRVGGSRKLPGLLSRTVYSTTKRPFGTRR